MQSQKNKSSSRHLRRCSRTCSRLLFAVRLIAYIELDNVAIERRNSCTLLRKAGLAGSST